MTTITNPDGTVVDSRTHHERPRVSGVNVHDIDPRFDIAVHTSDAHTWATLGGVAVHAVGASAADRLAHLAAIGRAITEAAESARASLAKPVSIEKREAA